MASSTAPAGEPAANVVADLIRASWERRPSAITELVTSHAARMGLIDAGMWLVDLQQRVLVPFGKVGDPGGAGLAVDTTLAGRAYRDCVVQHGEATEESPTVTTWVPLFDGSHRIGVLGGRAEGWREEWAEDLMLFGTVVATMLAGQERYSDAIIRTRRLQVPSLASEMQWSLLPPLAFVSDRATICGVLEPAYDIGGDTFDYAVNDDVAHLAVFDAMGHGLGATTISSVAIGAYRHTRRTSQDLLSSYDAVDEAIGNQFGAEQFATGVLGELNLDTGEMAYVGAGHPPALVLRRGHVVRTLRSARRLPFGLSAGLGPLPSDLAERELGRESLEPGDRVLLFTDGVIEGRDRSGQFFGLDRLEELFVRAAAANLPAQETLRRLMHAVLDHQDNELQDDASLLLVDWHGG